jgi:hypothetical protein
MYGGWLNSIQGTLKFKANRVSILDSRFPSGSGCKPVSRVDILSAREAYRLHGAAYEDLTPVSVRLGREFELRH